VSGVRLLASGCDGRQRKRATPPAPSVVRGLDVDFGEFVCAVSAGYVAVDGTLYSTATRRQLKCLPLCCVLVRAWQPRPLTPTSKLAGHGLHATRPPCPSLLRNHPHIRTRPTRTWHLLACMMSVLGVTLQLVPRVSCVCFIHNRDLRVRGPLSDGQHSVVHKRALFVGFLCWAPHAWHVS
jgi:hypothetical protein